MGVQCGTVRGVGSLAYRTLEGGGESPMLNSPQSSALEGGKPPNNEQFTVH